MAAGDPGAAAAPTSRASGGIGPLCGRSATRPKPTACGEYDGTSERLDSVMVGLALCGRELGCMIVEAEEGGLAGGDWSGSNATVELEDVVDDEEGRTDCSVNMNCRGNKSERMIPM